MHIQQGINEKNTNGLTENIINYIHYEQSLIHEKNSVDNRSVGEYYVEHRAVITPVKESWDLEDNESIETLILVVIISEGTTNISLSKRLIIAIFSHSINSRLANYHK